MFFRGSRYENISDASLADKAGRAIKYKRMRFIPQVSAPPRMSVRIVLGDRPDLLSFRTIGDPEQFWRLADSNGALHPNELTARVGARIRITLPEGIPGVANA